MRRPLLALGLLVATVGTAAQSASTGSNGLPATTTAVHRATSVTGATAVSLRYTVVGDRITGVTPRLRKTGLLTTTVTARFGTDAPVVCTAGLITVLNALTGLGEADYTCTGFLEDSERPRPLRVTAS